MRDANGLPEGWSITPLSSVLLPQVSRNPKTEEGDFFEYVDIDALDNKKQVISTPKRIAKGEAPSRARMGIHKGDVIFSLVRPYLKNIAIVPESLNGQVASTAYCVLRPAAGIEGHFLFYQVLQDSFIHSVPTYGNSPPSARDDEFLAMRIRVAPINQQRRIVAKIEELFSDLDAGVAALERIRANLKRYRAAVLKAAVEGKLTEAWRATHPKTEPASKLLERIRAERRQKWEAAQLAKFAAANKTPPKDWRDKYVEPAAPDTRGLPELPRGWCWATIEQISEFAKYGSSAKSSADCAGVPVLRIGNIQDGSLDLADLKYLPQDHNEFPDLFLREGDLLFNRTNSAELVGKSAVYRGNPNPCSYASYLIAVRTVCGSNSEFVCYYLNSWYGRTWIASVVSQQVGQANVNGTKLQALVFPLPPEAEQSQIIAEVELRFSNITAAQAQVDSNLKRAARLRQSILKRAFEGKLVPQDPADEPADKLLERIEAERNGKMTSAKPPRTRPRRRVSSSEPLEK